MTASLRGKAFLEKLETTHGLRVCAYVREKRVQSIDTLIHWLKGNAATYFDGKLLGYPGEIFPYLLEFVHVHAPNRYEPESFRCEDIPVVIWILCANHYGTVGKLSMALRDTPHEVPRGDVYLAFRIGVISAQEMELVPPRICTKAVRQKRWRR